MVLGIQPNIIVVRTEKPISEDMKDKLALFCDIDTKAVIECLDADTLIFEFHLLYKNKIWIKSFVII